MHREKPHKLLQVGVTPTPATNLWKVSQLPDHKSGVVNKAESGELERLNSQFRHKMVAPT